MCLSATAARVVTSLFFTHLWSLRAAFVVVDDGFKKLFYRNRVRTGVRRRKTSPKITDEREIYAVFNFQGYQGRLVSGVSRNSVGCTNDFLRNEVQLMVCSASREEEFWKI